MSLSFTITETMSGLHHFVDPARGDANDRRFYFRLDWGARRGGQLNPFGPEFLVFDAAGQILVDGLTTGEVPCTGTLELDYFGRHTITYALDFEVDGERYHFVGEKVDVNPLHPIMLVKTHTTCYGTLTDSTGTIVSRSVTHFEPSAIVPFITSFRLGLG
jgi:hypothetical protein